MRRPNIPLYLGEGESIPKRPADPTFLKVLPIDVDDPQYIIPDPKSFVEGQEVVIISGTFAGQIGALKAWTGTSFAILLKIEGEEGGEHCISSPTFAKNKKD